jgi:replicative DNA helicase
MTPRPRGLISMRGLMESVVEELRKPKPRMGACTGSAALNVAIGGFRHGHVTVFGAKRGWGKTSYGNLVVSRAIPECRVLMFAGEDAAPIYGRRFLAMRANLNAMKLRDHQCDDADWPRIMQAIEDAPPNPFFVRVEGRTVEWMAKVIREVAAEEPIDLVIADYLQCFKTAKRLQDRRNEVTYVTKTLSDAIKGANAAGLLFSQLKRTERAEPEVEDLKESGDIEDMADHILLGWKTEVHTRGDLRVERKIKLGKNKDGVEAAEIREVLMHWSSRTASFLYTPATGSDREDFTDA